MRAPLLSPVTQLLLCAAALVLCQDDETGYMAVDENPDDLGALDVSDSSVACPSDRLLRMRDTCYFDGTAAPCIRLRCCDEYRHIAGRCLHKSVDPCSLRLCEQACEVRGDSLWCTCQPGFKFLAQNYRMRIQPYCVDVDECARNNGGCEHRCVNDPGGFHCECTPPYVLTANGRCDRAIPIPLAIAEPMPLIRASSRCFAPCDTVTKLARKVRQLSDQLLTMQTVVKKMMESPVFSDEGDNRFAEGTYQYRVLDSIAPLEGGYCRCERGPRGPPGAQGMEGPKGDEGPRGPRGARGPRGSLDFMLLLVNDLRHDIRNLEAKVYAKGERPDRYDINKAWRHQRKQEMLDQERRGEQELEAYTVPPVVATGDIEISPNGLIGEVSLSEETTEYRNKEETEPFETVPLMETNDIEEQIRQIYLLANSTGTGDDEEEVVADYDYS